MFRLFLVALLLWAVPAWAVIPQSLPECTALCNQYFPGGTADPVKPPPATVKVFPHKITFENDSDQGNGAAAILFRTLTDGAVSSAIVNGELARKGIPYKGCPVFLMSKPGTAYSRPLRMIITAADGQTYAATGGSGETPAGPDNVGDYEHKATYTSYGVRNQGRQAWRINKRGDSLGPGPVRFTFSSGKTFTVKSTAKNCRDREDTCSRDSRSPLYGFVFKPGNGKPNGEGDSDIGTDHGGIYLHAPFGDSSKTVTMYW